MKKIHFWATIGRSYAFVFRNFRAFISVTGISIIIFAGLLALFGMDNSYSPMPGVTVRVQRVIHEPAEVRRFFMILAGILVCTLAWFITLSVTWNRFVLVGERSPFWQVVRFGRREGRFLLYILLIAFIGLIIGGIYLSLFRPLLGGRIPAMSVKDNLFDYLPWMIGAAVVLIVLYSVVCTRLAMGFPAASIDHEDPFWSGVDRGRGNTLRLYFGAMLVAWPMVIVIWCAEKLATPLMQFGLPGKFGFAVVSVTGSILEIVVTLSFFALAYKQLTES